MSIRALFGGFRFFVVLFALSAVCRNAGANPALANASVTPNSFAAPGGKIAISAVITDSTAAITAVSALLYRNGQNYGSFSLTPGAGSLYSGSYTLPVNTANTADAWTVRIYAVDSANHSASSDFKVTVTPDTGPSFTNNNVAPLAFVAAGGKLTVGATIADAGIGVSQAQALLLHNGAEYGSFPLSNTGGSLYSGSVVLPANPTTADASWTVRLLATSMMKKTTSMDSAVTVGADTGAVFTNVSVLPNPLSAGGGKLTVSANIADTNIGITQATVTILKNGVLYSLLNMTAVSSVYSVPLTLANNGVPAPVAWTFRIRAVSGSGLAVAAPDINITQPGRSLSLVSGQIILEGSSKPAQSVTLNFRSTDNGVPQARTVTLGSDGGFAVADIPQGTYKMAVKGYKWLQAVKPVDTTGGDVTGLKITLHAGDANNDNVVDSSDFNLLVGAYGSDAGDSNSGYDVRADFNDDGVVDSSDFNIFAGGFGAMGDL